MEWSDAVEYSFQNSDTEIQPEWSDAREYSFQNSEKGKCITIGPVCHEPQGLGTDLTGEMEK